MRRSISYCLVILFFFFALSAHSQQPEERRASDYSTVYIQGTVKTPSGRSLSGARVEIRNVNSDQIVADTSTDADGNFALLDILLTPDDYVIRASQLGSAPFEKDFSIPNSGGTLKLHFELVLSGPTARAAAKPPSSAHGKKSSPPKRSARVGSPGLRSVEIKQKFRTVRVFYATDRKSEVGDSKIEYLGTKGAMSYGSCDVSIPETHSIADIERPSIWKLEFREDPEKHIMVQKIVPESQQQFFGDVAASVSNSSDKDAFVFVHGYNVSFEDAAMRTAQLAYDFGFKGAPIFYSWPSKGTLFGYTDDERSVKETVADLKQFLADVATRSGAKTIHLIAHSMGNRALLPALASLQMDPSFKSSSEFHEVILAAPDVDRDVFIKLASEIRNPTRKVTLYISSHDQALQAAQFLFRKPARAGEAGAQTVVLPGMDTIDVSRVSVDALGHSYYGDNSNVVKDLLRVLRNQSPPRPGLSRVVVRNLAYWLLQIQN